MKNKIKILFVEHDDFDLYLIKRELKKSELNYQEVAVENEEDFVIQLNSFKPDIVLSDFNLPTFSGLRAFEIHQQINPNIPFIFVSGIIGEEKSIELIKNGVTDYVLKDKLFSLSQKINRALREFEERESKRKADLIIEFERNNLKGLINNTNDLIWSVDTNFNLITSNKAFDDFLEHISEDESAHTKTKKTAKKGIYSKLLKRFRTYYRRAFNGEVFTEIEYIAEPVETWTEISFYPIRQGNKIIGTACYSRDITNIKQNEKQIKINERRFRALVESGDDSVVILNANAFPLYVSPTIEKILGYTEEEALQTGLFSLIHENDATWAKEFWKQILDNPGVPFTAKPCRMKHKNGTWRWMEGTLTNLLHDEAIGGIVDNFKDVTERKKAKDLLLLTQFGVEHAGDGIFWLNKNGKITNVNNAGCLSLEYSMEELLQLSVPDIDPNYSKDKWDKHFIELSKEGTLSFETVHKTKSGRIIPVDVRANYVVFDGAEYNYAFVRDISERKKAEDLIKKSEAFNRSLIDSLSSHIAVIDQKGFIITINDAWRNFAKQNTPNGLIIADIGSNYFDACNSSIKLGNQSAADVLSGINAVMNELIPFFYYEYDCHSPSEQRWFALRVVKFKDDIPMVIVAHENITDLRRTKQERDSTYKDNIKLQKNELELSKALVKEKDLNELKSRFVSMASHEFRRPLSTIMSSLSLVKKYADASDLENQHKHIIKIKKSINNLTEILDDFLSVSKLEEGKIVNNPEETNLKQFIEDITNEMQLIATNEQTISVNYSAQEIVSFDKKLLQNIIINLISNALKFSIQKGVVEVIVEEKENFINISVKDHGIGISEEDQKHLFTRFFRGHNATHIQGTGLGLNIVAKYAELINATISLESHLNEGTTFCLKMPK